MFKFGKNSVKNIQTVDRILQELASRIISRSNFDFGVLNNGGLRTSEEQHQLYLDKKSKCDGYIKKSYHQSGLAIDFVPYIDGRYTWGSKEASLHIAEIALEEFPSIYKEDYYLHWGGFWHAKDLDGDSILEITDKLGWDLPHFELRKVTQTRGVYPIEWED